MTLQLRCDLRMVRLAEAIGAARAAVVELRGTMPRVNDPKLTSEAAPVIASAQTVLGHHAARPGPTIADDIAVLLASINQLPISREDPDLGPLPGLKALRGARGNLREELNAILVAAKVLGWRPTDPLLEVGSTEIPGAGLDGMLQALVARIEAVEVLLDRKLAPEGHAASGRTAIQVSLVTVFVESLRVELSLAKLEARVKDMLDLAALGRAVESMTELTADFVASVRGIAAKMTAALKATSEELQRKMRRVSRGFRTVVKRAVRELRNSWPAAATAPPPDFDLERAHAIILAGESPPISWRPWIIDLDFALAKLRSLGPLAGLTALQTLDLRDTQVSDLAPLADLTALQTLQLWNTQVSDLAPLARLTALQALDLRETRVSDLAPLAGLTVLRTLRLGGTQVSDLAPLAGLSALQTLDLEGTQASELAPLAALAALQTLDLEGTQASDLAPLATLAALQTLYVRHTKVSDLTPLAALTALRTLYIRRTQVSDLTPLAGLTALQALDLGKTQVSDLAPLVGLTALQALDLQEAQVNDLAPLAGLIALKTLCLGGVQVSDLAPLADLASLRELYLEDTRVSDLAPLAGLEQLKVIWVESDRRAKELARTRGSRGAVVKVLT